jgi:hypothetical protein
MDDDRAWVVRQEVKEGPTMLSGTSSIDYRKFRSPSHRFVLVGFDDEKKAALIADRIATEVQVASYGAVAKSRNPPDGMSTYNLWGKFHDTKVARTLEEACAIALRRSADRMLGHDRSQFDLLSALGGAEDMVVSTGLEGLAAFADSIGGWHVREDAGFLASYGSQVIEKFGTGGGNFRKCQRSCGGRGTGSQTWCGRTLGLCDRSARLDGNGSRAGQASKDHGRPLGVAQKAGDPPIEKACSGAGPIGRH